MAAGDVQITICGNLVADPELRFTPNGHAVASFRVASTPRYKDQQSGEWKDGEGLFLTCNVWRQQAEHAAESLIRGMRVVVVGRLKQRSYEKDGQKRTVFEVEADDVAPSLKNATAKVTKAQRSGGGFGQDAPPQGRQGGQRDTYGGQGRQTNGPANDPWATSTAGPSDDSPPF